MTNDIWDRKGFTDEKRHIAIKSRVLELTLDNKTRKDIAPMINRSITKVWKIQQELKHEGKLKVSEAGYIIKEMPDNSISRYNEITRTGFEKYESIKNWILKMQKKHITDIQKRVGNFWKVCVTLDVHPNAFLADIEEVEKFHDQFILKFQNDEVIKLRKWKTNTKTENKSYLHYTTAIKSFMKSNGISIPSGYLEVQRTTNTVYSRIHLNDEQRKEGIKYFSALGLSFLFILHHELGVRIGTLLKLRPEWNKRTIVVDGNDCTYYIAHIYEGKQKKEYEKIILTPEAINVVKDLVSGEFIVPQKSLQEQKTYYNQQLREFYEKIGLISKPYKQYRLGTKEWYLVNESTHVIRHSCVHKLMRISGQRAEVVASNFWEKPETLNIYHKNSWEEILQQNICYYCNPPKEFDMKYERFCTITHAIAYYNGNKK